jgi:hypothetical protein
MMSGNGGGSFAAILLSIPLTAVALMSVFGVPQLSKIVSSLGNDHDSDDEFSDSRSRSKRRSAEADEFSIDDAEPWGEESEEDPSFGRSKQQRPRTLLSRGSKSETDESAAEEEEEAFAMRETEEDETRGRSKRGSNNPFEPTDTVTKAEFRTSQGSPRSDFAAAIRRLSTMKVDRWNLEPGLTSGQFLFVCIVDPQATSGAVHRFEAEAREPAAAVDDVIQQISEWQSDSSITRTAGTESSR